jgi:predicted porin
MKKSLLALAALSAIAGAAQAQSSVTVYGTLDVGFAGGDSRTPTTPAKGTYAKTVGNVFTQSAESTSNIGFKGTEDLGGGSSAFFRLEYALAPTEQNINGNTNTGLQNRYGYVGLKKNGVGEGSIGLQTTSVFKSIAATDPGQQNNVAGNILNPGSTGLGSPAANDSTSNAYTSRIANTLELQSDTFAGFKARGQYTLNAKNSTEYNTAATATTSASTSGGNRNVSGWGLAADYTYNKFFITAAYQAYKQLTTASNGTAAASTPFSNPSAAGIVSIPLASKDGAVNADVTGYGTNVNDQQSYVGATYDFGILKAYASWMNRKATSTADTAYYLKRSGEQIGVRGYVTPTIEAWASGALVRYTAFGQNNPTVNGNAWQLGSNYWLSKRTNLYAIYGQTLTSTGSYTISNSSAGSTSFTGGSAISNYAVGVRHTF